MHTHVDFSIMHNSEEMEVAPLPIINKWIENLWDIHTIEYYTTLKTAINL